MRDHQVLFYVAPDEGTEVVHPPEGLEFHWFEPSVRAPLPKLGGLYPFGVWFLFTVVGVFPRGTYRVLELLRDGVAVHRLCVFPRYFRFPFMTRDDLQVGDSWTDPSCRGQGLATAAMRRAAQELARPERYIWGLIEVGNKPSIRVVEKAGFRCIGGGRRVSRFGVGLLGKFIIDEWLEDRKTPGRD